MPLKTFLTALVFLWCSASSHAQTVLFTGDSITGRYREVSVVMHRTKALDSVKRDDFMYIHEPFLRTIVESTWIKNYKLVFNEHGKVVTVQKENVVLENNYRDTFLIESTGWDIYGSKRHYKGSTVYEYDSLGRLLREKQYMPPNLGADTNWPKRWFVSKIEYVYLDGLIRKTKTKYSPPDSVNAVHTETSTDYREKAGETGEELTHANGGWLEQKKVYNKNGDFTRYNYAPGGTLRYTTRLEYTPSKKFKRRISLNPDSTVAYQNLYYYDSRDRLVRIESKYKQGEFREVTSYNRAGQPAWVEVSKNKKLLYKRVNHYNADGALSKAQYFTPDSRLLVEYTVNYVK